MSTNIDEFKKLVDAEEFFIFFNLPYDQKFVNVNRLHILKKFSQFMSQIDDSYPQISDRRKIREILHSFTTSLSGVYRINTPRTKAVQGV